MMKIKGFVTMLLVLTLAVSGSVVYSVDIDTQASYKILETYITKMPDEVTKTLKYNKYASFEHYVVLLQGTVNIRNKPGSDGTVVKRGQYNEKFAVLDRVQGKKWSSTSSDQWYRIYWTQDGKPRYGYITVDLVTKRSFQFDKMYVEVSHLETHVNENRTGYINNFRNVNGAPPLYKGQYSKDDWGILRYQSAPAYDKPVSGSSFRYVQDGKLVDILEEVSGYYKVYVIDLRKTFYIPKKYVTEQNSIKTLRKVVVVDRKNQNEAVFEKMNGSWHLISNVYATTGANDKYRYPTELGSFMAIYTRDKFLYLDDETKELAGYAPYALRFNGGAFIHGVPVNYILVKKTVVIQPAVKDASGNIIKPAVTEVRIVDYKDPGMVEYSSSLGTTPKSHKCVRNYTSHAKFIYDWIEIGASAVIVIE
jgi:hypothetical protein